MKLLATIAKNTNLMEVVLFAGIACLALTAGYASMSVATTVSYGDITGSAHPVKVAPLATMQAMPEMIPAQQH